jgi:hypothetical protein
MPRLSNEQHETFARRYVQCFHAERAALQSGYASKFAGARLLTKPEIAARVRELNEAMLKASDITAARVMLELGRVAFADIRQVFDDKGHLIPIHELSDDAAASIAGIEHESKFERSTELELDLATGEMVPVVKRIETRTAKIKRFNKDAALGTLAKHFKLVGDEGDGVNALASALADRLKTARKRIADKGNTDESK